MILDSLCFIWIYLLDFEIMFEIATIYCEMNKVKYKLL